MNGDRALWCGSTTEVARQVGVCRSYMLPQAGTCQPSTPPYPKGGAYGGA
ncbi:hypothetical protein ABIF66_001635 [Bradyrhizobium japonicum]